MYTVLDKAFRRRHRIRGTLTARSPVHVGSGDELLLAERLESIRESDGARRLWAEKELKTLRDTGVNPKIAAFYGSAEQLYLPGSSLKGLLHSAWGREHSALGKKPDLNGSGGQGGKVLFFDAKLTGRRPPPGNHQWWLERRGTCLAPGIAIDPHLRTAREGFLFYTEFVPPGAVFAVELLGQGLEDGERNDLLTMLATAFPAQGDGVRLGAGTANGWGQLSWHLSELAVLDQAERDAWLQEPGADLAAHFRPVEPRPVISVRPPAAKRTLIIGLSIKAQGRLLVNDPSQRRPKGTAPDVVGHAPLRRRANEFYLPESSLRGALRAQARRIWQTCAQEMLHGEQSLAAGNMVEVKRLPRLLRLFGAGGWRSPIEFHDLQCISDRPPVTQHFVAIDRFTGGAADSRKFQALALDRPEFKGELRIDVDRLEKVADGGWWWLLLAFLLRDLQEGDIPLGWGASKGYGAVTATYSYSGQCAAEAQLLTRLLRQDGSAAQEQTVQEWNRSWQQVIQETTPQEAQHG